MQTSTDHPNAALIREGLEAFNSGDVETYAAAPRRRYRLAPDRCADAERQGGDRGVDASPESGESITTKVHDVVGNDEHVIAMVEAHATRADGRTLDYRTTEIVHMRDGKVTERWAFSDDTQKIIDFFAR